MAPARGGPHWDPARQQFVELAPRLFHHLDVARCLAGMIQRSDIKVSNTQTYGIRFMYVRHLTSTWPLLRFLDVMLVWRKGDINRTVSVLQ